MPDFSADSSEKEQPFFPRIGNGERRRTIFENTEIYQIIFQEGYEKGYEEGFFKGFCETQCERRTLLWIYREGTLRMAQERWPDLINLTSASLAKIVDLDRLGWLYCNIRLSMTQEEAREVLEDGGESRLSTLRRLKWLQSDV